MSWIDDLFGKEIARALVKVLPRRGLLNFSTSFTVTDNPSTGSTDIDVAGGGGGSYIVQVGTDADTTAQANKLLSMPTVTASRTISLPASPSDGTFVLLRVTNGFSFDHVVSGNGKNINNGLTTPASTYTIANDGALVEFIFLATLDQWVLR